MAEQVTQLTEASYMRQLTLLPFKKLRDARITLIGAGAVGSCLARDLSKIGVGYLEIFDDDEVSEHNIPNQWFRLKDIGRPKVNALKELVQELADVAIDVHTEKYQNQRLQPIVVSSVDTMETRLLIWDRVKKSNNVRYYIDTRMGAEVGNIFVLDQANQELVQKYETEDLYPSDEAFHAPCTERSTMYCASGLSAFVSSTIGNILADRPYRPRLAIDFRNGETV
jgi:molybdopterin/thiamine biosynthesis adenylyltransferase